MKMSGEQMIPAPPMRVWEALNDPEVLQQAIPGCQELVKNSPTEFAAKITAKVGPVKANFAGNVTLSDIKAPESYVISGQGQGGAAGFAKGGAHVRLAEADGGTRLVYDVDAQVGGKLAQLGSRLIDSTARKMADDFFTRFNAVVTGREPPQASPEVTGEPAAEPARETAAEPARKAPAKKKAAKKPAKKPARKAAAGAAKTRAASTRSSAKKSAGNGKTPETDNAAQDLQAPPSLMPEAAVAASATSPDEEPGRTTPETAQPFWTSNGAWWLVGVAILALILVILLTS